MSSLPKFFEKEISDEYVRENFRKLREFFVRETPFLGFKFFEVEFTAAQTDFQFKHGLGFQPKDVILTSVTEGAAVSFDYDQLSAENVVLTVSAACVIRFLAGAFT